MPSARDLDAAVLCGGLGTRLRSAVPDCPKCLAPVGGSPFLGHLLRQLSEAGCRRIVLCVGVGAAAVRRYCAGQSWASEIVFSEEPEPLGTGGALALARAQLRTSPVIVTNGDSILPGLDWGAAAERFEQCGGAGVIVAVPRAGRKDTGALTLNAAGQVFSFAEKPMIAVPAGWDSAGVYLLSRTLLERMSAEQASSLEQDWIPRWTGVGLYAYRHAGPLVDIGTPERWREAQAQLAPWV